MLIFQKIITGIKQRIYTPRQPYSKPTISPYNQHRLIVISFIYAKKEEEKALFLKRRCAQGHTQPVASSFDEVVGLEVFSNQGAHVVDGLQVLQEANQLQQLRVTVVIVPALDGDAVVDVVTVRMRRVVHQNGLK